MPPGGGDDYDLDNDKRCIEEGYTLTSCPEGYKPYNYCPYDNTYFEKCVEACPSDYVTCEEPYYGVGEACDGKYASCECTPCGAGYDYTTIPEGYVQDGEACLDCDGKTKYKIKLNPCDGYMDCGNMGPEIGAGTCQSGNETLYDNCKACPYECSLSSCPDNYTCTKEECSGMYCKSGCQPGYDWDAAMQSCTEQCAYKCTLSSCPSGFVCEKEECSGKYCKIGCQPGYNWNAATQTCTKECKDSCPNGYSETEMSCKYGTETITTELCGKTCYKCKTPTCSNGLFYDSMWDDCVCPGRGSLSQDSPCMLGPIDAANNCCTDAYGTVCLWCKEPFYYVYSDYSYSTRQLSGKGEPVGIILGMTERQITSTTIIEKPNSSWTYGHTQMRIAALDYPDETMTFDEAEAYCTSYAPSGFESGSWIIDDTAVTHYMLYRDTIGDPVRTPYENPCFWESSDKCAFFRDHRVWGQQNYSSASVLCGISFYSRADLIEKLKYVE